MPISKSNWKGTLISLFDSVIYGAIALRHPEADSTGFRIARAVPLIPLGEKKK
jgi:hypothetical protein